MKPLKKNLVYHVLALAGVLGAVLWLFHLVLVGRSERLLQACTAAGAGPELLRSIAAGVDRLEWIVLGLLTVTFSGGGVLLYYLTRWQTLRRSREQLVRLENELREMQRRGDFASRLSSEGRSEIDLLVQEINQLLLSMEVTRGTLERSNAEMQQRVAERTTALAEANAALEADIAERVKAEQESEVLREQLIRSSKMEAVGTLAGGIAHDFNNILAGMLGHIQIIAGDLPANHPAQAYLSQVIAAGDRATSLVRQILAFSRQTHGERRLVSVGQVAREALSLLRAALPSGITIKCDVEAVSDLVHADPTQLHQVFMNLGANAGHAIGSRGGQLTIRISNLQYDNTKVGFTQPMPFGDYVSIEVRDTGCGMSREVLARIFDPFFSTKPINEGTGLGLAVVHGIIADHGGNIRVESEPGQGTAFRILLPAAEDPAPASSSFHALPLQGDERILIVDDEELVLDALGGTLERLGYKVTAELKSPAAWRRFQETPDAFDLIITDQTMPQMSGLELSDAVHELRPKLPVILVTGFSPEVSGRSVQSLGVVGVLGKPVDFADLTSLMRAEFEARKHAESLA